MSISDIPTIFREEKTLILLFPSIGLGYLYHVTGDLSFLIYSMIALISPAYNFSMIYSFNVGLPKEQGITPEKISVLSLFLGLIPAGAHLILIYGLVRNMDHTDYILVFLFLTSVFLVMMVVVMFVFGDTVRRYNELYGDEE